MKERMGTEGKQVGKRRTTELEQKASEICIPFYKLGIQVFLALSQAQWPVSLDIA